MTAATELARMAAELKQLISKFSFEAAAPTGPSEAGRTTPHRAGTARASA